MSNERVAIIGGGPTGLALAYWLGQTGRQMTLIEKGRTLSGLLAFTTVGDIPIERFYHHFFTTDTYLLELLRELGLENHIRWHNGISAVAYDEQLFPLITKVDYLRLPFLRWGTKLRGVAAALKLRRQRPVDLPSDLTAETYLRRLFGDEGWEKMWRPLLTNKFGDDVGRISAQWVAQRIMTRTGSARRGREVLGYLQGSYRVLFDALRQAIARQGSRIILNCEVSALPQTPAGRYVINNEEYDVVIGTIAPELMKKIVPELDLPAVRYRGAIVPLLTLRSAITPYYWINILDRNWPFSVIVNQQALLPPDYYQGRWPLYVGHYVSANSGLFNKSDAELAEYYLSYLRRLWPGIDNEVVSYEIGRTKNAQPIITAPWRPLSHTTNVPKVYLTSMAHIFPEDRGVNYAIREAKRVTALVTGAGGEKTPTP